MQFRKFIIWSIFLALVVSACSTKKNTFTRRAYHNLTAHYNPYWNGNESLKEGVNELRKNVKDNYNSVLLINNYGTTTNSQTINPNMDRAIEKASKVIQKHSMYFDKKEHVKWVIESYLMIGKANFYKQDYNAARRAFEYVNRQYPKEPIRFEAQLWLAKTYTQQKQYDKAINQFDLLNEESKKTLLPWKVRKELPLAQANMFIAQEKYSLAREQIEKGLPLNRNAKLKTRLNYILAQIYQLEGKDSQSGEYFTKVLKSPASFEMAFNARINLARVYNIGSDKKLIIRELEKMLKDMKNNDFQDQIYYALADIALKDKNDTLGISHLRKSVATSLSNDYQRSTSSLRLADLYFARKDYRNAQAYYDTTLMSLPKDFPNVEKIEVRTETLSRLVENLQLIYVQDSLQNLAAMPEAQRNAIIEKAIADFIKKEEEAKKKEEALRLAEMVQPGLNANQIVDPTRGTSALGGGGWYFYNPSAISMGFSEFTRKWGRRKLEDNWRLSNKREVNFEQFADDMTMTADTATGGKEAGKGSSEMRNKETYLKNLPFTPESIDRSNGLISQAMFNSGIIYLEELIEKPKAAEMFTSLINRFPENEKSIQSNYHLYRIYRDLGDEAGMNRHKSYIINTWPESDYAKILADPDYKRELEAIQNRVKSLYEETYLAFNRGQYRTAIIYSNEALASYTDVYFLPRFAFLRAVSLGKTDNQDTMRVELNKMIEDYPDSDMLDFARRILGESTSATAGGGDPAKSEEDAASKLMDFSMYKFNPAATHFYALIVDGTSVNVYGTKVRITDFNTKNYNVENLQVNSVLLDNNRQLITVSSFNELDKAIRFFNGIKNDEYVFSGIREGTFEQFLISAENYPVFFKEKNSAAYKLFFDKNYPNK
jgi:tetratricopeptide (TPR) repeat protein